jgi:glyoxylase-like metal-dependent hydrolase (beta-lactamase superfamily II)
MTKRKRAWWNLWAIFWYPEETGRVAGNLFVIRDKDVNLFIYRDVENVVAIDAGYNSKKIEDEFKKIGINPEEVTHLFLTHTDHDHVGRIDLFKNAKLYFSKDEEQMINRTTPRLFYFYYNPKINKEYHLITDGEIIRVGKIKVKAIATPGHTPGSMCFLINEHILLTGDTVTLRNGKVYPFYSFFNMNTKTQRKSINKLAKLENIWVLCTAHTGCTKDFKYSYLQKSAKK